MEIVGNASLGTYSTMETNGLNRGFYTYKSGATAYGVKLQHTGGEYGTLLFGPNQTNRFLGFGKVGAALEDSKMIEYMRVDLDNGNVGIGTNAPTHKLEIVGAVKAASFIGSGSSLSGVVKTENDPVWLSEKSGYLTLNGNGAGLTNLSADSINGTIAALNLPTSGIWNAQGMTLTNILVKGDGSGLTNLVEKDTIWNSVSGAVYSAIALKQNALTAATDGELAAASNALSSANAVAAMRLARVETKTNVWNTAYAWGNHATNGYVTGTVVRAESDPQVGVIATSYLPKWNGSALVSGTIFDNGNVGIGTTTPSAKLDVSGGAVKLRGDVYCGGNLHVLNPGSGLSMGSFTNGLPSM